MTVFFFQNAILFDNIIQYGCNVFMDLVKYSKYFISSLDTDKLVLWHQGITSYSAEYAPMYFQCFRG